MQRDFDRLLNAPRAPSLDDVRAWCEPSAIPIAMEVVRPGRLNGVIARTSEFFLITRVAAAFDIAAPKAEAFTIDDLRRSRSPQVGLALAALGRIPWISATVDQRRVIVRAQFLEALNARGGAS